MRLACAAFVFALSAQQLPDARTLLNQRSGALKNYRSYQYESEMTIDMTVGGNPMKMTVSASIAGVNPDKIRLESKTQMGAVTAVSDGEYT